MNETKIFLFYIESKFSSKKYSMINFYLWYMLQSLLSSLVLGLWFDRISEKTPTGGMQLSPEAGTKCEKYTYTSLPLDISLRAFEQFNSVNKITL